MKKPYYIPASELAECSVGFRVREFAPGEGLQYHFHSEIEIQYVERGQGYRQIGGVLEKFSSGAVVLIPAHVPHFWVWLSNGNEGPVASLGKGYCILFSPEFLTEALARVPEMKKEVEYISQIKDAVEIRGKAAENIGRIFKSMQRQDGFNRYISFLRILKEGVNSSETIRIEIEHPVSDNHRQMSKIQEVFNYLDENQDKKITLEDVSSRVNMSVSSFCKFFKKVTGQTFTESLNNMRIKRAEMLLLNNDSMSISEIAYSVGYDSLSHFNHTFLKLKGETPTSYRSKFKEKSF